MNWRRGDEIPEKEQLALVLLKPESIPRYIQMKWMAGYGSWAYSVKSTLYVYEPSEVAAWLPLSEFPGPSWINKT